MNSHHESQEAPSERPAEADPSPGEGGMGNALEHLLERVLEERERRKSEEVGPKEGKRADAGLVNPTDLKGDGK